MDGLLNNKKVLVVDDELYIRDLYKELLTSEGYQVDTAIDGDEGLKKIQEGGYDLIFLDVMMPKLDGIGILKNLKDMPSVKPNKKIVLLTNLANDPVLNQAKEIGADDSFIKSDHTPDDFLAMAKKYLNAE